MHLSISTFLWLQGKVSLLFLTACLTKRWTFSCLISSIRLPLLVISLPSFPLSISWFHFSTLPNLPSYLRDRRQLLALMPTSSLTLTSILLLDAILHLFIQSVLCPHSQRNWQPFHTETLRSVLPAHWQSPKSYPCLRNEMCTRDMDTIHRSHPTHLLRPTQKSHISAITATTTTVTSTTTPATH